MKKVIIHTDGSCLGNPGPGGWAAVLRLENTAHRREICGGFRKTTNNRMEITAVIEGLSALKEQCEVVIFTDSQYVSDAINKGWIYGWLHKHWLRKNGKAVPNADLWKKLLALLARHQVKFNWLRGHDGDTENERCDELARKYAARKDLPADPGYENVSGSSLFDG